MRLLLIYVNMYIRLLILYITDMHHGLNLTGIDNIRSIEYAKKHSRKLLWSSSEVKKVQRHAEKYMQEVIFCCDKGEAPRCHG
jgi:hypothetical protein